MSGDADIDEDYEFARAKYYNLAEKGGEAIDLMIDLARETEHPRAFEVLSTMIKQNAEILDRLMELQKKKKEVHLKDVKAIPRNMTQNNTYIASSADLQRLLLKNEEEENVIIEENKE